MICLAALATLAGCAPQPLPPASSTTTAGPVALNPANIKRIRPAFPPGYEVADLGDPVSVAGSWGFGPGWTADPPQCAVLADPGARGSRGLSASGQGGTLYAVVADAAGARLPDAELAGRCAQWTMTVPHTTGTVALTDGPAVSGADTITMTVTTATVVESGTETDGRAQTALAYLGDHVAFVTLVTDPGSVHPPLDPAVVADLLAKTVAALRG